MDFTKCSICRCVLAQRQRANWPVTSRPSPLHLQQLAELDTDGRGVEAWGRRAGTTAHRDLELGLPDRAGHAIQMSPSACGAMAEELSPPDPGLRAMEPWRSDRRGACRKDNDSVVRLDVPDGAEPSLSRASSRSTPATIPQQRSRVASRSRRHRARGRRAGRHARPTRPTTGADVPACCRTRPGADWPEAPRWHAVKGSRLRRGWAAWAPGTTCGAAPTVPDSPVSTAARGEGESDSRHVDQGTRPMLSRPARRASAPREDGSPKPETELTIGLARKGTAPT